MWRAHFYEKSWVGKWIYKPLAMRKQANKGSGLTFYKSILSRYTNKIATSDHRIETVSESQVRYGCKDYRDGQFKSMQLSAEEFIRRFLLHVLPSGFMRIRHYGLLSNRSRAAKLEIIRSLLN